MLSVVKNHSRQGSASRRQLGQRRCKKTQWTFAPILSWAIKQSSAPLLSVSYSWKQDICEHKTFSQGCPKVPRCLQRFSQGLAAEATSNGHPASWSWTRYGCAAHKTPTQRVSKLQFSQDLHSSVVKHFPDLKICDHKNVSFFTF